MVAIAQTMAVNLQKGNEYEETGRVRYENRWRRKRIKDAMKRPVLVPLLGVLGRGFGGRAPILRKSALVRSLLR